MTRAEIGNYLGMTLETVSRALSRLARDKVIRFAEKGRREISIPDVGALSRFVQRCLGPRAERRGAAVARGRGACATCCGGGARHGLPAQRRQLAQPRSRAPASIESTEPISVSCDRRDADEAQDVALQRLDAVGAEIPAVDQRRHAHRDHQARRAAVEPLLANGLRRRRVEREARPRHLLQKALQQRRHVAQPERKEQHEVLRPSGSSACAACSAAGSAPSSQACWLRSSGKSSAPPRCSGPRGRPRAPCA